jgi:hypothetical protein
MPDGGVQARVAEAFRQEYGRVVASVLRIVRDIDAAEEVVQEAFAQALDHWPAAGTPHRPGAWLLTTARRRALDHLRRARRAGAHAEALAYEAALGAMDEGPDVTDPEAIPDDRLRLRFRTRAGAPMSTSSTSRAGTENLDSGKDLSLDHGQAGLRQAGRLVKASIDGSGGPHYALWLLLKMDGGRSRRQLAR